MAYKHKRFDGRIVLCDALISRHFKETDEKVTLHFDKKNNVVAITFRDDVFEVPVGHRGKEE